jgi:hypothetical protein
VLLLKIQKIQEQQCLQGSGIKRGDGAQSLQFLTTFAVDLTKLISVAYERVTLPAEGLRELLTGLEPDEKQPLVKVAQQLFRTFVAFERGATRSHVLAVIKDRIWSLMDATEKAELFSSVVWQFLSKPEHGFSQKSVVDALDALRIPAGDLIWFLSQTLGLGPDEEHQARQKQEQPAPERPLVMVSSILILSMRQLQRVDAVEVAEGSAGQEAFLRI